MRSQAGSRTDQRACGSRPIRAGATASLSNPVVVAAWRRKLDTMEDAAKPNLGDPVLQKRLAKYLVQQCFRNSMLEDLHAGIAPSSKAGDYSDVVVHTPFGEIPWARLSRLDDEEMKVLMIDVVDKTYQFIRRLFDAEVGGAILRQLAARDLLPRWEDPK